MVAAVRPLGTPLAPRGRYASAQVRGALTAAAGRRTPGGVVVDALLVLIGIATSVATVETQGSAWQLLPSWWVPVDVAVGVIASVGLWWRRSHPVLVAVVLGLLGGVFIAAGFAALVSLYTVASLRALWIALVVTGAHLVIAVPYYLVVPLGDMGLATWSVTMVLLYAAVLAIGVAVRARRQVIAGLVEAAETERGEHERRLSGARDDERARIAREMHDVLAHRLSILSVHAGALEHRSRPEAGQPLTPVEMHDAATVIRSSAHTALTELREVLHLLGAAEDSGELGTAPPQPTAADLPRLVAEAAGAGQRVRLLLGPEHAAAVAAGRPQLQRTLYRVVQEGLTNARKHAPHASVVVEVTHHGETVRAVVRNPVPVGVAPTEVPGSRAGLTGLAERVRLDGGSLATGIDDGQFRLQAQLPWRS